MSARRNSYYRSNLRQSMAFRADESSEDGEHGGRGEHDPQIPGPRSRYSTYAAKKAVAQGMMDIALLTANANQLRYLIEFEGNSPTFHITLGLIIASIVLQLTVGILLIIKGRYHLKEQEKLEIAETLNNIIVVGVFLVSVINVFIANFSISGAPAKGSKSK